MLLAEMQNKRWEAEQSHLDAPATQQPGPATKTSEPTSNTAPDASGKESGARADDQSPNKAPTAKDDPFFKPKDAPGEKWQPESWTPTPAKR